jgi:Phospholipase_D-nuclease N-terminal
VSDFVIFMLIAAGMIGLCAWIGAMILIGGHPVITPTQKALWMLIVTVIPIIGPVLYFAMFADRRIEGKSYRRV